VERVTGIGGFFFRADDPDALARWYAEHLGVGLPPSSFEDDQAAEFEWFQEAGPTVFAPLGQKEWRSPHLGRQHWGVNFRVRDLDAIVAQLRYVGITVEVDHAEHVNGRFAHLTDPEGNAIQLWEPA
jgi:predicted enzyme related to lactoylglutathione lyase